MQEYDVYMSIAWVSYVNNSLSHYHTIEQWAYLHSQLNASVLERLHLPLQVRTEVQWSRIRFSGSESCGVVSCDHFRSDMDLGITAAARAPWTIEFQSASSWWKRGIHPGCSYVMTSAFDMWWEWWTVSILQIACVLNASVRAGLPQLYITTGTL